MATISALEISFASICLYMNPPMVNAAQAHPLPPTPVPDTLSKIHAPESRYVAPMITPRRSIWSLRIEEPTSPRSPVMIRS